MKRSAMHFLFILLLSLQTYAPLVHAHIGGDSAPTAEASHDTHSPHIHDAGTADILADNHHTQAIEIGHAIKQRDVLTPALVAILIALSFILVPAPGTQRIVSLAPRCRGRDTNYFPSPRAPPSA